MTTPLSKINAILQATVKAGVPGISAAVSTPRNKHFFTAGASNLGTGEAIESTHLFGIGSITKVFVAVVVLQLVEEGRVELGDKVGRFLGEEVVGGIENAAEATLGSLLNHTAGVDSWEDDPAWIRKGRGSELDGERIWGKTEALDFVRRARRTAPAKGEWGYSNTHYTLLGLVVEAVTGKTMESEIRARILQPLGMKRTFLEGFERLEGVEMTGRYHWATEAFRETAGLCPSFPVLRGGSMVDCTRSNLSVSWVAGGMVSCTEDLLLFAAALQQEGRLLKKVSLDVMKDWTPTGNERLGEMGHGLFRIRHGDDGRTWLGHSGGVLGFSAGLFWTEEGDCTVCMLSNVGVVHTGGALSGARVTDIMDAALELVAEE